MVRNRCANFFGTFAHHALSHPGTPLKEYQIATEVFGRPSDFDPQVDSTIRVQAGRLRAKLAEYYAAEGADDSILVEVAWKGPMFFPSITACAGSEGASRGWLAS